MNRLASESSPYLLQHASNPVEWYPWGGEAIKKAKAEDRPIFLSIGYSSCHWCHVMAHESFEDPDIAVILNGKFVPVKVDREERPDIDAIYMRAAHMMGSAGGWPLSVFLTPDLEPFFAGTYFPPERRWGVPAFKEVLEKLSEAYAAERGRVRASAEEVIKAVRDSFSPRPARPGDVNNRLASAARREIMSRFDRREGGFGSGPKFPQPPLLNFLISEHARHPSEGIGEAVLFTLEKMARGGIRDQVGGGFHRYSVDGRWMVPHFEKMLYDNAQLASLYFNAGERFKSPALVGVGDEVLADMCRTFAAPGGGFISALDADSGGGEGAYYLWSEGEVGEVLGGRKELFFGHFGIAQINGIADAGVLFQRDDYRGTGLRQEIVACLENLRLRRASRVSPGMDIKVLTDWNSLAAKAFFEGFLATGNPSNLQTGLETVKAIWERAWDGTVLYHVWDGERAKVPGFLSDYAYLADAHLMAFTATGEPSHLSKVGEIVDLTLDRFSDTESDALFDSAPDGAEAFLPRVREAGDGVLPSPLAIFATTLWKYERITGQRNPGLDAERILAAEGAELSEAPGANALLASLATAVLSPPVEAVIAAGEPSKELWEMLSAAKRLITPEALVLPLVGELMTEEDILKYAIVTEKRTSGGPFAYLCRGGTCLPPAHNILELKDLIEKSRLSAPHPTLDR